MLACDTLLELAPARRKWGAPPVRNSEISENRILRPKSADFCAPFSFGESLRFQWRSKWPIRSSLRKPIMCNSPSEQTDFWPPVVSQPSNAWTRLLIFVALLASSTVPCFAEDRPTPKAPVSRANEVQLHQLGEVTETGEQFVIVHGQGGLRSGDRFHALAEAIHQRFPDSPVFLVDWTKSSQTGVAGVALPWRVCQKINPVAVEAAKRLQDAGLDPARTTLIGESFGVYVNAQLAKNLGGVHRVLAFNPACGTGGYWPPDLKTHATQAWSFHTWSFMDTSCSIAHTEFFLETPADATSGDQHVSGIPWLATRLNENDTSWLLMTKSTPASKPLVYTAKANRDGTLSLETVPRVQPKSELVAATGNVQ